MAGFNKTHFVLSLLVIVFATQASSYSLTKNGLFADGSCEGRCNVSGTVPGTCQCNTACIRYNDCCEDYYSLCLGQAEGSCAGRCDQSGTIPGTCQCNKPCVEFGDCCPDYEDLCGAPTDGITDKELEDLAEELLALDVENNVGEFVTVDLQGKTSSGSNQDVAPNPLLSVQAAALTRPTIQKLIALHDNYVADVDAAESYSQEEQVEMEAFIDAIFNTPVMQRAQEFMVAKNLPNGREKFYEMWFGLYKRGSGALGSSGFEHVFLGEHKNGVSGFHNWEFFAAEEAAGRLNYRGYMDFIDLGSKGSIVEHNFVWSGQNKPISSMFVGTSPELELSLYTVCFLARPSAKCPIMLAGNPVKIQTYTIGSSGQYVATSYPDLSN